MCKSYKKEQVLQLKYEAVGVNKKNEVVGVKQLDNSCNAEASGSPQRGRWQRMQIVIDDAGEKGSNADDEERRCR